MTQALKSRSLSYFDADAQCVKSKVFSALEQEQAHKVFDTVEYILLENELKIRNKWVSIGRCDCQKHDGVVFMVEISSALLSIEIIHEIEEALEGCHAQLLFILSEHEGEDTFLRLIIFQEGLDTESETTT